MYLNIFMYDGPDAVKLLTRYLSLKFLQRALWYWKVFQFLLIYARKISNTVFAQFL